jgi:hypothetical protein
LLVGSFRCRRATVPDHSISRSARLELLWRSTRAALRDFGQQARDERRHFALDSP